MQNGAAWTVFQRRLDSSVDFYRGWQDYKNGFGNSSGNFWLGLEKIHRLTKSGQNVLRVDLTDFENDSAYAQYTSFYIASESENYTINVGRFSGKIDNYIMNCKGSLLQNTSSICILSFSPLHWEKFVKIQF